MLKHLLSFCCFLQVGLASLFGQYGNGRIEISFENIAATTTTIEFDVYLKNTSLAGITSVKLAAFGGGIQYNSALLASGASITPQVISQPASNDFSGLFSIQSGQIIHQNAGAVANHIRWNHKPVGDDLLAVNMPNGTPMKFARIRLTSSLPWNVSPSTSNINLTWYQGSNVQFGKPQALVYYQGNTSSTAVTFYHNTASNGTLVAVNANATLSMTGYIEGFLDGSSMRPVKFNSGLGSPTTDCDDIQVELHQSGSPFALVYSFTGTIQTNGTITCTFPGSVVGGNFYIAVKGRNFIETWSASPVTFGSNTIYNFSTAVGNAFGNNMVLVGVKWAFFSGDMNLDGTVDGTDYPIWEADANNFLSGYIVSDLNGDGVTDGTDYSIWEANANNFVSKVTP